MGISGSGVDHHNLRQPREVPVCTRSTPLPETSGLPLARRVLDAGPEATAAGGGMVPGLACDRCAAGGPVGLARKAWLTSRPARLASVTNLSERNIYPRAGAPARSPNGSG